MTYNGWANWDTWNMNLWLTNSEYIYRLARSMSTVNELERLGRELLADGYIRDGIDPSEVDWQEVYDSLNEG